MRIAFAATLVAIFFNSANGQSSCVGQTLPVRPAMACANPTSLCLCGPNGTNCHWEWVCPTPAPSTQADPSIPLGVQSPKINDPAETMLQIERIRQMQQRREQHRQKAARSQDRQPESVPWHQTGPTWRPEISAQSPYIRYMSLEARQEMLATMPKPTGKPKRDERAWDKWWSKYDRRASDALPAWSPEAYEKVRAMFGLLDGSVLREPPPGH